VLQVPSAADVVLADLLDAPPVAARVVVATPLAAYVRCGDVLVGVLAPTAVRVPGSLVVPPRLVAALRPGDSVLVGAGTVVAAGVRLAVHRWWDSVVSPIRRVAPPPVLPAPAGVPDAVVPAARVLRDALAGGDEVRDAVRRLVGLGPGLTPAGDDVVAGALVALVGVGDLDRAGAVRDAVRPCRHRTTALSAALLDHAAAGRAVPQLARYLNAPADPGALSDLLAVGGTSGAGLALGAAIGLSCGFRRPAARMASPADREVA
jgi:Protein of unknown function (DUF2877)